MSTCIFPRCDLTLTGCPCPELSDLSQFGHRKTRSCALAPSDDYKRLTAEIERLQAQVQSAALDYLALDGQASEALARATAAEAETKRLRARIDCAADMAEDMWRAPQGSLWNYGTTPSARERAKWEGVRETAQDLLSIIDPDRYRATLGQKP